MINFKLLITAFTMVTIVSSHQLNTMEQRPYAQLSPITLPQTYLHLSEILHPDIARYIFSLQLDAYNINFTELTLLIEQNCKRTHTLLLSISKLLNSCGHDLATGIFKQALSHAKISICDIKDEINWTILHEATIYRYTNVVELLLQAASDKKWALLTTQDKVNSWTPSHYAAEKNQTEISELLLKAAGNKTCELITETKTRQTILHIAVLNRYPDIAKLLINAVGDKAWALITAKDHVNGGGTALHYAAERGHTEVVKLLLDTAGNKAQEFIYMLKCKETAFDVATPKVKEIMQQHL